MYKADLSRPSSPCWRSPGRRGVRRRGQQQRHLVHRRLDEAESDSGGGARPRPPSSRKRTRSAPRPKTNSPPKSKNSPRKTTSRSAAMGRTKRRSDRIFQGVILPNIAQQGEEIAALTPPEGDESTIEELTSTWRTRSAKPKKKAGRRRSAGRGDQTGQAPTASRPAAAEVPGWPWLIGRGPCRVSGRWT